MVYSCDKPFCIESRGIEGAGLTINFFNKAANEYFYPENKNLSPYSLDSLRVTDSKGNLLSTPYQLNSDPVNPLKRFNVVDIYPIFIPQQDAEAYNSEQTKYIFIRYNYTTYDTIRLVYKAERLKCINNYQYINAYYKNTLIAKGERPSGLIFTLNH